ncbi:MAG: hypothetical protein ABJP48_09715 [Erythrobacter sp.]
MNLEISLFGITSYISDFTIPDRFEGRAVNVTPELVGEETDSFVLRLNDLESANPLHLCKFVTFRNKFDYLAGEQYFGEVRLSFLDILDGKQKLVTVAHCRASRIDLWEVLSD